MTPTAIPKVSLEKAVETACVAIIKKELGLLDTLPVLRSDESQATDDFSAIVITTSREETPMVIDEGDYRKSSFVFEVEAVLRSLRPRETQEDDRFERIEAAMRSADVYGLDLSRFLTFWVMPGSSSETEQEEDGRKTRTRKYRIVIEEDLG
jgi:hypothetical protein